MQSQRCRAHNRRPKDTYRDWGEHGEASVRIGYGGGCTQHGASVASSLLQRNLFARGQRPIVQRIVQEDFQNNEQCGEVGTQDAHRDFRTLRVRPVHAGHAQCRHKVLRQPERHQLRCRKQPALQAHASTRAWSTNEAAERKPQALNLLECNAKVDVDDLRSGAVNHDVLWMPVTDPHDV